MGVIVYTSSASANTAVKNKQKAIIDFLKARKIEFEEIDLCVHIEAKDVMRKKIPEEIKKQNEVNQKVVIPPQVFNGDEYCGDYEMFFNAREMELLHTFFKVPPDEKIKKMKFVDWDAAADKENSKNSSNVVENGEDQKEDRGAGEEVKPENDATKEKGEESTDVEEGKGENGDAELSEVEPKRETNEAEKNEDTEGVKGESIDVDQNEKTEEQKEETVEAEQESKGGSIEVEQDGKTDETAQGENSEEDGISDAED